MWKIPTCKSTYQAYTSPKSVRVTVGSHQHVESKYLQDKHSTDKENSKAMPKPLYQAGTAYPFITRKYRALWHRFPTCINQWKMSQSYLQLQDSHPPLADSIHSSFFNVCICPNCLTLWSTPINFVTFKHRYKTTPTQRIQWVSSPQT